MIIGSCAHKVFDGFNLGTSLVYSDSFRGGVFPAGFMHVTPSLDYTFKLGAFNVKPKIAYQFGLSKEIPDALLGGINVSYTSEPKNINLNR